MAPRTYPGVARLWYVDRKGVKRQTNTYFIKYSHRGKRFREKTGKTNAKEAYDILLQRKQEMRTGRLIGPKAERITVDALEQLVIDNYAAEAFRTPKATIKRRFIPLREYFGTVRMMDVTPADLSAYVNHRRGCISKRGTPMSPGTINLELAHLQRGFTIAVKSKLLPEAPEFPSIRQDNARKVFIDRPTLSVLMEHLPDYLRPVFEVGLLTGWRKEAILSRQRRHVDLRNRWITLDGAWSKNGQPVTVSLSRPLRTILVMQERLARQLERSTGRIIPWVFFYPRDHEKRGARYRAGDRVRNFEHAFNAAKEAAGIPHVRFHDLRRGAIRTLRRAGASEHEIMEWVGLKTRSVFDRYDIIDEERKRETAARQEAYYEEEGKKRATVAAFRRS